MNSTIHAAVLPNLHGGGDRVFGFPHLAPWGALKMASVFGALVFGVLATGGCGPVKGYPGPTRPSSELATVDPNAIGTDIGVVVDAVDGMPVECEIEMVILPGHRTLGLRLVPYSLQEMQQSGGGATAEMQARYNAEWRTSGSIEFDAAAGETYGILGRWNESVYAVTVVRDRDDAVVASRDIAATRHAD